jgi:hypothetical protein
MRVPRRLRLLLLAAHITASVGWLGTVTAFLVVAVTARLSDDDQAVRGAFITMETLTWFAIVPLSVASLATGIAQSLVTHWGLVRHYWVVFKLVINLVATIFLLLYTQTLDVLADEAAAGGDGYSQTLSPVLHGAAALGLLLTATTLAVYKPPGMTPYGLRRAGREG